MEVAGEGAVKKEAEGKVSKVRYEILMVLSDLRVVDVSGPEKIEGLKKVMLQKAKKALAPAIKVVGIYPEEWVIQ
jgi:flagellar basal body-associated protein FliL